MPHEIVGIEVREGSRGKTFRAHVQVDGRRVRKSFPTLAAALHWRDQAMRGEAPEPLQAVVVTPTPPARSSRVLTIEDAARTLCRGMVAGTVRNRQGLVYKPSVCRKYEEALRTLVLPRLGGMPVAGLTRADVQRLVDAIAAERSPEHARRALVALRVALRPHDHDGTLPNGDPCRGVRAPADPNPERPARILTPEEALAIIDAAAADDRRLRRSLGEPLLGLLFGTGLRLGEALALPWGADGLNLDAGVVRVRRSVDRARDQSGRFAFVPPKTRTSWRDVPLRQDDVARLRQHWMASGRPEDGELVFPDPLGRPLTPNGQPRYAFQRACRDAGTAEPLPKLHDLRHAYASALLAAGLTVHAVAELLGHSSPALVMARYGHAFADEKASAARALDRLIESRPPGAVSS